MMARSVLDFYVDESGNFGDIDDPSRYCVVTVVLHEMNDDFSACARDYENGLGNLGVDFRSLVFHTSPLIRQEGPYSTMSRNMRGKIFYQMLSFVRKCDLRYVSFIVDVDYVSSEEQVLNDLRRMVADFMCVHRGEFERIAAARLYYDAGQKGVSKVLEALIEGCPCQLEVMQGVLQGDCLLLQVADFLCTVSLVERRVNDAVAMNSSERRFFGSPRDFKRNVLRKLRSKVLRI